MSHRFDQIFLHVGLGKTGTSSIQKYFELNRDYYIDNHSLLYPILESEKRPFRENHGILVSTLFHKNSNLKPINRRFSQEEYKVYTQVLREELTSQLDNSTCSSLLISGEGILNLKKD